MVSAAIDRAAIHGFGYVMNRAQEGMPPGPCAERLIDALYRSL